MAPYLLVFWGLVFSGGTLCKRLDYIEPYLLVFWGLVFSGGTLCKRLNYSTIFVGILGARFFWGNFV